MTKDEFRLARMFTPTPLDVAGVRLHVGPLPYAVLVKLRQLGDAAPPPELVTECVAHAVVGPDGKRLFDPEDEFDLAVVAGKPAGVLRAIAEAAIEASAQDVAAAKKP